MKKFYFILTILIICLSTWFSISYFNHLPRMGKYQIGMPDSILFFRLLEQSIFQGHIIQKDYYQSFPYVVQLKFPPFHRALLYHLTLLTHLIIPNLSAEAAIGYLPPILGIFTTIGVILLVLIVSGNIALTLVVGFFCFPNFLSKMTNPYMMIDHHFLVNTCIWLWIIFATLHINFPKKSGINIIGGIASAILILSWVGSPLFVLITSIFGFLYLLFSTKFCMQYVNFLSDSWLIGGGLTFVYLFSCNNPYSGFSLSSFSYLHPLVAVLSGLVFKALIKLHDKKIIVFGIVCVSVLIFLSAGGSAALQKGITLITNKSFFLETISELSPIINIKINKPIDLHWLTNVFGPVAFFFLFPVLFYSSNLFDNKGFFLRDVTLCFILLSFNQVRYLRWLANGIGIYSGLFIYQILHLYYEKYKTQKFISPKLIIAFTPLFILNLNMCFLSLSHKIEENNKVINACIWLKRHTPDPGGYMKEEMPKYGVLGFWDKGNIISYYAQRPACVSNTFLGLKTMADVYAAKSEVEGYTSCLKNKIKYILLQRGSLSKTYLAYLDEVKKKFVDYNFIFLSDKWKKNISNVKLKNSFYFWLAYFAGIKETGKFGISEHFQLRWTSTTKGLKSPEYMIYEAVKGCKIKGKYKPSSDLSIKLNIKVHKNWLVYVKKIKTDSNGEFNFTVPYPTKNKSGGVQTDEIYIVYYKDKKIGEFQISKNEVDTGASKTLSL